MLLRIFKIALRLRDRHVFMWTISILQLSNKFSGKRETFSKKLEYRFLVESPKIETHHFHTKLSYQKLMLRQIECWVQNGLIITTSNYLIFLNFCFSLSTSQKELIWCTNDQNPHIPSFCKRWSLIWRCFFPVSILESSVPFILLFRSFCFCDFSDVMNAG